MSAARETRSFYRIRRRFTAGTGRLKTNVWPMVQTSVAASVAYFLATVVLDNEQPFFAPIAAVISLGLTLGQRGRRTVEVVLGVVVGLLIADLVVSFIGVSPVQIGVVVALAMAAAVFSSRRGTCSSTRWRFRRSWL
jgi:uncharacterized membrane protein YgaE (UPF0421/DUF939 family)